MKKLRSILLIVLATMSISKVSSQIIIDYTFPDYDTVMIFQPQQFVGYPMALDDLIYTLIDSVWVAGWGEYFYDTTTINYAHSYAGLKYVELKNKFCLGGEDTIALPPTYRSDHLIGTRHGWAYGFAQPYHLEDSAIVAGIALYSKGHFNGGGVATRHIYLLDTNMNEIARGNLFTDGIEVNGVRKDYIDGGINMYHFNKKPTDEYPKVKDFLLGFDVDGGIFTVNYTCRIDDDCLKDSLPGFGYCYDTIFYGRIHHDFWGVRNQDGDQGTTVQRRHMYDSVYVDTIPCCPYSGHPYFRDPADNQWKSFEEHEVWNMYRNIFFQALPIILVPHQEDTSSLAEINIDDYCYVYPNPTRTMIKAVSNFKIWTIEMIDMNGRKVYKKDLDNFMDEIDVSHFAKGTYVVNLFTSKGRCTKKILVQ